ncbi:MAG TPA: MmcQ/YjbR family DNA-binding protein [Candidatus Sulfotelmatobacter sp.]
MNVDEIRAYCLAFPQVTENIQWGDDLCFKIRGKIFVILALTAVPQKLCCKCSPERFAELVEREDIGPAPYVGRYKWVILNRLDALRSDELRYMLRQSYEMVAANAPKVRDRKPSRQAKNTNKKTPVQTRAIERKKH